MWWEVPYWVKMQVEHIVEVTTKQEYRISVLEIDRWKQRLSLYFRQMCLKKMLKNSLLIWPLQNANDFSIEAKIFFSFFFLHFEYS